MRPCRKTARGGARCSAATALPRSSSRGGARTALARLYPAYALPRAVPARGAGRPAARRAADHLGRPDRRRRDSHRRRDGRPAPAPCVTTQAAEKIYRSLGPETRIDIALTVGADAWLEWLPQETILFDRARLARRTGRRGRRTGGSLAGEMLVFGRRRAASAFTRGRLHDRWQVWRDGRLVWADAAATLDGDIAARLDAPFGFGGAAARWRPRCHVGADTRQR